MKVGFTGTRKGMTGRQGASFHELINRLSPSEFHHGDCVGADDEAAKTVDRIMNQGRTLRLCDIVCHPPIDETHRAHNDRHDVIHPPLTHFARNRAIVDSTDVLIATPCERPLGAKGGTAYTVGYARKKGKPVWIVWPDGSVSEPEGVSNG